MAWTPKKPRWKARSTGADLVRTSAPVRPSDPGQPDLFVPSFIPPMKPKLHDRLPEGDRWLYEIKHDGYRIQAHVFGGAVTLFTKSGLDWTDRLPAISGDLAALEFDAVLDGEAVMLDEHGASDFFALHAAMARKSAPEAILFAFDLLWLDGEDMRVRPLLERRTILAEQLIRSGPAIHLSEHHVGDGPALLKASCEMGLEGIVSKRQDAPYRSGYQDTWRKVKCTRTEPFAVIGFDPHGRRGVAALKLARLVGEALVPCGNVGSGFSAASSAELRAMLDAGAHLVVDVEHRGFTPAGELRHAVFTGWHRE